MIKVGVIGLILLGWLSTWNLSPLPKQPPDLEALGAALFFDPVLSIDESISCSSCHQPPLAFTDGHKVAIGVDGRQGTRNTMTLNNLEAIQTGYFWDGRVMELEEQVLHPITQHHEMGADLNQVLGKLSKNSNYQWLFEGSSVDESPSVRLGSALATYLRSIALNDSKFDRVMAGKENFTLAEERGWAIFFDATDYLPHGECSHCHVDRLFTNQQFFNNGISAFDLYNLPEDQGQGGVTGIPQQIGRFRTPTLRNIAVTAPYMHDGRFQTLEEVMDHYNSGGHKGFNVNPNVRPLHLSTEDMKDVIAFLHTLTDRSLEQNKIWP
ncbi:MAG: cytochrome-c peroxidase [Saprospiraceae bacterium]